MAGRTPPSEMYPAWTQARYWSFIRSALRRAWCKYPPKYETMNAAKRPHTGTDRRRKFDYQCSLCKGWFKQKDVEVDHIEPAGTLTCYDDLPGFVYRLYTSADKLRVLCKECHKGITAEAKLKKEKI